MSESDQDALDYVKRMWRRGESRMTARRAACDKRHRAYLGILEGAQDLVKDWRSALAPPYVLEVIETAYAMAFAEPPRSRVIADKITGVNGAAAHELLIEEQRRDDVPATKTVRCRSRAGSDQRRGAALPRCPIVPTPPNRSQIPGDDRPAARRKRG